MEVRMRASAMALVRVLAEESAVGLASVSPEILLHPSSLELEGKFGELKIEVRPRRGAADLGSPELTPPRPAKAFTCGTAMVTRLSCGFRADL
jgi:hypothetical protein